MRRLRGFKIMDMMRNLSSPRHDSRGVARLGRAAGLLLTIFVGGTFGYYIIGRGEYDLLTCAYMTVITLTSIGYGEVIPISGQTDRVIFTIILVVLGMGSMFYFVSQLTAFIVDGELRDLFFHHKMKRGINQLKNHFIVAGVGSTGQYVLKEMVRSGKDCIIIESNTERLELLEEELEASFGHDLPYVIGDATDDDVLEEAGIKRAVGIVFALGNDRDNLFATITARSISPDLRIITRGENPQSKKKFHRAGATSVIYTNVLGGMRMAAEVIRPEVTGFLDLMMSDHGEVRRIEELEVPSNSPLVGCTLRQMNLREHTDALVVAIHDHEDDDYNFNPGPNCTIHPGDKLILLTLIKDIPAIEAMLHGDEP